MRSPMAAPRVAATQQATTTTYVGATLGITCASTGPRRVKIYDLLIGTNGTPR